MQPGGSTSQPNWSEDPLIRLAASARGWHSIQMAVLGFIGICGVLRTGAGSSPGWLQWLAALLGGAALVVACLAIFIVGRVAYPFYGGIAPDSVDAADPRRVADASAQLRIGIRTTFVALVLIVIAALSGWWPGGAGEGSVEVRDTAGRALCGPLVDAPAGAVGVRTADGVVRVPSATIVRIRSFANCS